VKADRYPLCPNCGMKVDLTERFCWWCNEDREKHTHICTECGQPKNLSLKVVEYIREERKA